MRICSACPEPRPIQRATLSVVEHDQQFVPMNVKKSQLNLTKKLTHDVRESNDFLLGPVGKWMNMVHEILKTERLSFVAGVKRL